MKKQDKKVETGSMLATGEEFSRDMIPNALKIIEEKINALKGDKEKAARITGTLGQFGRVSDITDTNVLMGAYAYITKKGEAIDGCKDVFQAVAPTVKVGNFKEGGATVKQWQEEILFQYKEVVFKEELTKLEEAKKLLESELSEELKLAAKMKNVMELLKVQE